MIQTVNYSLAVSNSHVVLTWLLMRKNQLTLQSIKSINGAKNLVMLQYDTKYSKCYIIV